MRKLCVGAKSLQSCLTLCDPVDCSLPGSSVHGILQARILEWVPMPPPGDFPDPGIEPTFLVSPASAGGFFTTSTTWEAHMRYLEWSNSQKQKVIWLLPGTGGIRGGLLVFNGYKVLDGKGENVLEMDGRDGCTTV